MKILDKELYTKINLYLNSYGLEIRGNPINNASLEGETSTKIILLIGNIGSKFWGYFVNSNEYKSKQKNPLDNWSKTIINELAEQNGIKTIFPSDIPYAPFQQWAKLAEQNEISSSPIGPLMHETYGLWHAYRGAMIFDNCDEYLQNYNTQNHNAANQCEQCDNKICLSSCPINAFNIDGYDYKSCVNFLAENKISSIECNSKGCLARLSCPAAKNNQYKTEHHLFHLHNFKNTNKS